MATKRKPKVSPKTIPQWGDITAGPLTGWRFSFVQFVRVPRRNGDAACCLDLRCTPPNWPFPVDVRFDPARDDYRLKAGPRARQLNVPELQNLALDGGYARAAHLE